ncbi:MAG: class I SAM-dependent methyltransferase [Lachnospiraceae bacterium]|nr:class I SAM-dependent methyltransferase [Lachnospiraceae bacterium]
MTREEKLSARMEAIGSMVTAGYRLADIGTDHGYLPIALTARGRVPSAIAMDINAGPLEAAQRHIRESGLEDRIQTRRSDGLAKLDPGEADSIVIAGMGGALMLRILSEGASRLAGVRELILSPQSEIPLVRSSMCQAGYEIAQERMVKDAGKYYVILRLVPSARRQTLTEEEAAFGPRLLQKKDPVLAEWLLKEQHTAAAIAKRLHGAKDTAENVARREEVRHRQALIARALKKMEQ